MEPKIIKTEKEYDEALKHVEFLMNKDSLDKREIDELKLFGDIISSYEEKKWPISTPNTMEAIRLETSGTIIKP